VFIALKVDKKFFFYEDKVNYILLIDLLTIM